jgi:hypothetical protein
MPQLGSTNCIARRLKRLSSVSVADVVRENDPTDRGDAPLWRVREALTLPNEQS